MRWDFGSVYKEIRESKGLTQAEVCGNALTPAALSKIEHNKTIPNVENMQFLLRQVNMSFEEFDYICHYYKKGVRQTILNKITAFFETPSLSELEDLMFQCQTYLNTHDDLTIQHYLDILIIFKIVRTEGLNSENKLLTTSTNRLWKQLEKQDIWYYHDIVVLNAILFRFDIETLLDFTRLIFERLEKYKDFKNTKPALLALKVNLSTIFLKKGYQKECLELLNQIESLARDLKRNDSLALVHVRRGICTKNSILIKKGLDILTLIEEEEMLTSLQEEIDLYLKK